MDLFVLNNGIMNVYPMIKSYLRVFGYAVEGDVGAHRATIQLLTPVLGKHYYPHGVEYGENEYFPESLQKQCETTLAAVKAELNVFVEVFE